MFKKPSVERVIILVLGAVLGALLMFIGQIAWRHYEQPVLQTYLSFDEIFTASETSKASATKVLVRNEGRTTVSDVRVPILLADYKMKPIIVISPDSGSTVTYDYPLAHVTIDRIPPRCSVVVTIAGILQESVAKDLAHIVDERPVPYIGTIDSRELVAGRLRLVSTKKTLDSEVKMGVVVNRFMSFGMEQEGGELELCTEDLELSIEERGEGYSEYMRGLVGTVPFYSALVVLGVESSPQGRTVFHEGMDAIVVRNMSSEPIKLFLFDCDLMERYYENYECISRWKVETE